MRIFVDCTSSFSSGLRTGIERVVRNITKHADSSGRSLGVKCQPVILIGHAYFPITTFEDTSREPSEVTFRTAANKVYSTLVKKLASLLPGKWKNFLTGSKHEPSLARLIVFMAIPVFSSFRLMRQMIFRTKDKKTPVHFERGDILLLADSIWNYSPWAAIESARSVGAYIAAIVYDIIPVTHNQFFATSSQAKFSAALPLLCLHADGFFCISAYTESQLRAYYAAQSFAITAQSKHFCAFTLGVDLDAAELGSIRSTLSSVFDINSPVYLAVGTLEPRKNHAYLLRAFQKLWDEGSSAVLLIVGRIGWMCDEVLETIRRHPRLGTQLVFMDDVSDTELDYCYARARALLFASVVEGFGLPIIEALQKRLPVFASDIPVFHEVGGEYVTYFDLSDPNSLAELLLANETEGACTARSLADFSWPDWSQSTTALLEKLIKVRHPTTIF